SFGQLWLSSENEYEPKEFWTRREEDIGGIYTVLRSKAQISCEELGDQYCMFGPMKNDKWRLEVEKIEPENRTIRAAIKKLHESGFKCMYGRWLIDGYPKVILFDLGSGALKMNEWKQELFDRSTISTALNELHVILLTSSQPCQEITGLEAEYLLDRKPDILTPNGLNVVKFSALHEFQNLHSMAKEKIHNFIRGHFHGHLDFDLDKTLYLFTAG
ncbi:starch synthase, partial [Ostertagia ostertagi]